MAVGQSFDARRPMKGGSPSPHRSAAVLSSPSKGGRRIRPWFGMSVERPHRLHSRCVSSARQFAPRLPMVRQSFEAPQWTVEAPSCSMVLLGFM